MNVNSISAGVQSNQAHPMKKQQAIQKNNLHFGASNNVLELFADAMAKGEIAKKIQAVAGKSGLKRTAGEILSLRKAPTAEKALSEIASLVEQGKTSEAFRLFHGRIGGKFRAPSISKQ